MSFSASTKKDGDILHVLLTGNLITKQQVDNLLDDLEFEYSQGFTKVIIDLGSMNFMNSTGLNVLINILTVTRNKGGEVVIVNVPDKVRKLLLITKLDSVFDIEETIEQAKEKLK